MKNNPINKFTALADERFASLPIRASAKTPLTDHGFKDASMDPEQHQAWAEKYPDSNVAYATGAVSGYLLVVDIDVKNNKDGAKSFLRLERENGKFPETRRVLTPSGGFHLLFRYPSHLKVLCKVGFRDGIDIRADGGYCLAPPSAIGGEEYLWDEPGTPIAEPPAWLLEECAKPTRRAKKKFATATVEGSRNQAVMLYAFNLLNGGLDYERLAHELIDFNFANCQPPLPETEVMSIAENVLNSHKKSSAASKRRTDLGNAERLSELFSDVIRYHGATKQWLHKQSSGLWKRVDELWVMEKCRELIKLIYEEAYSLSGQARSEMLLHAMMSQSNRALKDAVDLFKSEPGIALSTDQIDQGEWLLPARNGLVNLKTGEFVPMRPELHITYTAGTDYDPNAMCPAWDKFLLQIMEDDQDLVEYLRCAVGYTLTTQTSEHALFFAYGSGANGKSTFLNVLRALFGDLGAQANGDMLLEKHGGQGLSQNGASSEVARLVGKRLVAMSEVEDGRHFSEKTVKWYTGGEVITARFLYQNTFEFKPRFKLWLAGNYKPTIKGSDHGIWRRLKLIPFTVTIPPDQRDPDLERKLCAELPGILNWALAGCQRWQASGHKLQEPTIISNELAEYRGEMDVVGSWLSEFTYADPEGEIHFGDTYKFYKAWSEQQFNFAYSGKKFGMLLKDKGFAAMSKPHRVYKGLRLLVALEFNDKTGAFVGYRFINKEIEDELLKKQTRLVERMHGDDDEAKALAA